MEPNAILAINSLDRYNKNQGVGGQLASFGQSLENQYDKTGQPCNNFQVGGFGALIYGYIKKIQVSQIQLEYNVPTVIPGQNDRFLIRLGMIDSPFTVITVLITIPFGFYTPEELAAIIQIQIEASEINALTPMTVEYRSSDNDFVFKVVDDQTYQMWFPDITEIKLYFISNDLPSSDYVNILKCYRLIGIDISNSFPAGTQFTGATPNFLYTPYVDVYSTTLTKYQKVKDNTTSASSDSTIIARIYLSGVGVPQNTGGEKSEFNFPSGQPVPVTNYTYPLGSRPFVVTQDCNTPKVIRWNKDETVYALDFQLRDQYGDLLFTQFGTYGAGNSSPIYYTEFQLTLMCIEGGKE
jgi:hypothetical protein